MVINYFYFIFYAVIMDLFFLLSWTYFLSCSYFSFYFLCHCRLVTSIPLIYAAAANAPGSEMKLGRISSSRVALLPVYLQRLDISFILFGIIWNHSFAEHTLR